MNDRAVYTVANALDLPIADKSVQMIATSPPYFGLRDYGVEGQLGAEKLHDCLAWARGDEPCGQCYVCNMRAWGREMWRVLRDDGCMFLNLGDSYHNVRVSTTGQSVHNGEIRDKVNGGNRNRQPGLKPKDLIGIPWRVALALQADGWYLRSDVIWAKPNPMPESVTDRPTKSHEYVFLLTKSARYFWDAEGVKEASTPDYSENGRKRNPDKINGVGFEIRGGLHQQDGCLSRNLRTVWNVATAPYAGAHFATWPPVLVERMIKAGSKPGDVVLDPFAGSGTTLMVSRQLGRIGLGFDLSETYLRENAAVRLGHDRLQEWGRGIKDNGGDYSSMPLFSLVQGD